MLNRIKLTNFRKHTNTEMPLLDGLMVLRGLNEAGKSTLLEGILYVLGGVKFLRSPLEEAVTWGEPVSSLKAELDLTIDGVQYHAKRSKSGAEVTYDGGRVTGQSEVTSFLFGKMGVEAAAAAKLMLANQNEIRGALEAGPKATTELIERLAEFDQIDLLIERMQERLTLGSGTALETQIAKAEDELAKATQEAVKPDFDALRAEVSKAQEAHRLAVGALEALSEASERAQSNLDVARAAQTKYEQAQANLEKARKNLVRFNETLEAARVAAGTAAVWEKSEEQLRKEIADLEQADVHRKVYARLQPLLAGPEVSLDNHSVTGLNEHIKDLRTAETIARNAITDLHNKIYLKQSEVSSGTCTWCGQDFSHLPQVAEKNAKLTEEIEALAALKAGTERELAAIASESTLLLQVQILTTERMAALESNPDYVERVGTTLPPVLRWIGPDAEAMGNPSDEVARLRRELKSMTDTRAAEAAAQTRYETLKAQKADVEGEVEAAAKLVELAEQRPSLAEAQAQRDEVLAKRRPLEVQASNAQTAARDAEYALRDAERTFAQAVQKVEHLEEAVASLKHQLKTLAFNNALLKRVRQCRPAIADKLWTIVLSAVSSYFSEMRGFKSRVTKDADGFKVDDHSVTGLSGSTLDILGLAIRVALVRTFLPNAPFLVLDEPCAAMDAARTEATLGFVVSCGFKQVLLVTHEDTSESVADHLIQL